MERSRWTRWTTLAAALCALVGCGDETPSPPTPPAPAASVASPTAAPPSAPDSPAEPAAPRPAPPSAPPLAADAPAAPTPAAPEPAAAPEGKLFLELVCELSSAPVEGRPDLDPDPDDLERLRGYLLAGDRSPPMLYPGLGTARGPDPRFWVGRRFRDDLAHEPDGKRTLEPIAGDAYEWTTSGLFPFSLRARVDGSRVVVTAGAGPERALSAGGDAVLVDAERRLESSELVGFLASRRKDLPRSDLERLVAERFPGAGPVTMRCRVSALLHRVAVADFDVLGEWNQAEEAFRTGDYETAEAALERVLAAVPGNAEVARRLRDVSSLLDAGRRPALLRGSLRFPAGGRPSAGDLDLWRRTHGGFATLAPADAPPDAGTWLAPIRDGAFAITVPTGTYRVTVAVPGYRSVERAVALEAPLDLEVELAR